MKINQKGVIILPILIVLFLFGIVGYFVYQNYLQKPQNIETSGPNQTTNWKIYEDSLISLKYPPTMIPARNICDSFILPDSDKERQSILSIRDKGIEIGYSIDGLELAFCSMSNPNNLSVEEFAKNHSPEVNFEPVDLAGYKAVKGSMLETATKHNFTEYFIKDKEQIVRIWYRYGKEEYKPIAEQILSIFKFVN